MAKKNKNKKTTKLVCVVCGGDVTVTKKGITLEIVCNHCGCASYKHESKNTEEVAIIEDDEVEYYDIVTDVIEY